MLARPFFPLFRFLSRTSGWLRLRFTPTGQALLTGLVMTGILGVDPRYTVIFQLFALLGGLIAAAMAWSLWFPARFTCRRHLPRFGSVDQPLHYDLDIAHDRPTPLHGLGYRDHLGSGWPGWGEFQAAREPGEETRNPFDRSMGFHRWMWLLHQRRGGAAERTPLPPLPPGRATRVRVTIHPSRRGWLRLDAGVVSRPDPLGVFLALRRMAQPQRVLILPRRHPLPPGLRLPGGRRYQRGGVNLAGSVGEAGEFVSLRDYRPGDTVRRIHWPGLARTGKPVVKEYHEEYFVRHALVLDTFAPPDGHLAGFEEAVSVAASFAATVDEGEGLLDLLFAGPAAHRFTAGRGVAHGEQMLELLAAVTPCRAHPFATLARLVTDHAPRLSGAVLVLHQWERQRQALVAALAARGLPLLVLLVVPPGVTAPPPPGAPPGPGVRLVLLPRDRIAEGLAAL